MFRDTSLLLGVWLRQRGLGPNLSQGGFGAFEAMAMMALLLQGGGSKGQPYFPPGFTHYQLFKAFLNFIATRDLIRSPMFLEFDQHNQEKHLPESAPIFFDGNRNHNVLFKMSVWSYKRVSVHI